mgnify:CR=1 FL=1
MAEATTGNDLTGVTQSTGIISRISTSISNVRNKVLSSYKDIMNMPV